MQRGVPNKRYTAEFKKHVVETMLQEKMGYMETARIFDVSNYHLIQRWERIYLEEGAEGLAIERRGRACSANGTIKGRKPKLDKQIEEDLIAENQRLRAENEYLKNLQALVLEDERRQRRKRR
jgi:transposase-like protein